MAYNDVAWDDENPFPGTLYNGKDGVNYHDGCMIDYQSDDVTKANFLAVLHGNQSALQVSDNSNSTRKVLGSNKNSTVFLYFSDHGAPGHLLLPREQLYADELNSTIQYMHSNDMYKRFIIFIEACESGSLFTNIDLHKYDAWALTATNATNPSFGTYCYPHDII